jgi:hypothetical protein
VPVRRDQASRARDAEHGERHLGGTGGRADSGRRREYQAADRVGTQCRGAERDRAAQRVADPHGTEHLLCVCDPDDGLGQRIDVARFEQRCRAAVARQVRDENAMLGRERRRDSAPVLDRPAEPVEEDER